MPGKPGEETAGPQAINWRPLVLSEAAALSANVGASRPRRESRAVDVALQLVRDVNREQSVSRCNSSET